MTGMKFGLTLMAIIVMACVVFFPSPGDMTNGHLGLLMLALIVVAIMLGFPTAFTLMGMGMFFGWLAFDFDTAKVLDLMVQRAYWVMTNDVLIAIPLFVFMGYIVERANIIDMLFRSLHLSLSRLPASLAVATLITCAVFATATGIVGAVVTLMGLLAFPAMLRNGYDVRLAAGAITAGGCLGILIPPSIMLIVYGATAGVSVVKLYAGAFLPGLMLATLYIGYVMLVGWWKPHLAPSLSEEEQRIPSPPWAEAAVSTYGRGLLGSIWAALLAPQRFLAARTAAGAVPERREVAVKALVSAAPALAVLGMVVVILAYYDARSRVDAPLDGAAPMEMGLSYGSGAGTQPSATGLAEPPSEAPEPSATGLAEPPPAPSTEQLRPLGSVAEPAAPQESPLSAQAPPPDAVAADSPQGLRLLQPIPIIGNRASRLSPWVSSLP